MQFLQKLLKAIAERKEKAIGLDIGSASIKMAEVVMRNKKPFLKRAAVMEMPEHILEDGVIADENLLGEQLSRMASQYGFTNAKVALALGGRSMFIREVVFPRMSEHELRTALRWDLEKYVPFSAEQLYFDYWIIGPGSTEVDLRILLVAVPRDLVDTLVRILAKAGLSPVAIEIEPLAIQRTLPVAQNCMLIDIGAAISQITLFQKGSPVFTRNIPVGGNRFTDSIMEKFYKHQAREKQNQQTLPTPKTKSKRLAKNETNSSITSDFLMDELDQAMGMADFEQIIADLTGEVRRTLEYYQVQNSYDAITRIFLTGGGANIDTLPERLSQSLDLPVMVHDVFANMGIAPSFDCAQLRNMAPRMAVAVGLAMRGFDE